MTDAHLNELEQLILLALVRLADDAYGVSVREEIEARARRAFSIAAIYAALERLERRGYVETWLSAPTAERGGRAKKHFRIKAAGATALRRARASMEAMWAGLESHPELPE